MSSSKMLELGSSTQIGDVKGGSSRQSPQAGSSPERVLGLMKLELNGMASKCGELSDKVGQIGSTIMIQAENEYLKKELADLKEKYLDLTRYVEMSKKQETDKSRLLTSDSVVPQRTSSPTTTESLEMKLLRKQLSEMKEMTELMSAQLLTYKEDFETERRDRERAQGRIAELEIQLQQLQQRRDDFRPVSYQVASPTQQYKPYIAQQSAVRFAPEPQYAQIGYNPSSVPPPHYDVSMNNYRPTGPPARTHYSRGFDVCDDVEIDGLETSTASKQRTSPEIRDMELRGRGVDYRFKDETDGINDDDETNYCFLGVAQPQDVPRSNESKSVATNYSKTAGGYPKSSSSSRPKWESSEALQCPRCFKSFGLEEHHLLVDHMEEVCMQ